MVWTPLAGGEVILLAEKFASKIHECTRYADKSVRSMVVSADSSTNRGPGGDLLNRPDRMAMPDSNVYVLENPMSGMPPMLRFDMAGNWRDEPLVVE